jgi:hypothetical protein
LLRLFAGEETGFEVTVVATKPVSKVIPAKTIPTTTPISVAQPSDNASSSGGVNMGLIGGAVGGSIGGIALVALGLWMYSKHKNNGSTLFSRGKQEALIGKSKPESSTAPPVFGDQMKSSVVSLADDGDDGDGDDNDDGGGGVGASAPVVGSNTATGPTPINQRRKSTASAYSGSSLPSVFAAMGSDYFAGDPPQGDRDGQPGLAAKEHRELTDVARTEADAATAAATIAATVASGIVLGDEAHKGEAHRKQETSYVAEAARESGGGIVMESHAGAGQNKFMQFDTNFDFSSNLLHLEMSKAALSAMEGNKKKKIGKRIKKKNASYNVDGDLLVVTDQAAASGALMPVKRSLSKPKILQSAQLSSSEQDVSTSGVDLLRGGGGGGGEGGEVGGQVQRTNSGRKLLKSPSGISRTPSGGVGRTASFGRTPSSSISDANTPLNPFEGRGGMAALVSTTSAIGSRGNSNPRWAPAPVSSSGVHTVVRKGQTQK